MSKWVFNLKFDLERDEYILEVKETTFRRDTANQDYPVMTEQKGIVRTFHKDSDVEWMKKIIEKERQRMKDEFKPSYNYFIESVGDIFIGKEEYNILLETNTIHRKEVTFIAKAYSRANASLIATSLNKTKPETVIQ